MGWLGTVLITLGNVWLAKRHINAFVLIIVGNICWLASGILTDRPDMMSIAAISAVIHVRNYIFWKRHNASRHLRT